MTARHRSRILLAAAVAFSVVAWPGAAQQPPRDFQPPPVPRVDALADLRPVGPDEVAIADRLTWNGPRLKPGLNGQLLPSYDGTVSPTPLGATGPPTALDRLTQLVCFNTTFVGTIRSRRVIVTRREDALITVGTAQVRQWIQPDAGPVEVMVARDGGKVYVKGELYVWPGDGDQIPFDTTALIVALPVTETAQVIQRTFPSYDGRLTVEGTSGTVPEIVDQLRAVAAARCPKNSVR